MLSSHKLAIEYLNTGVVEISPSPVGPVCQERDQLEVICNTTLGIDHQWKFTVFPENVSHTAAPVSSIGASLSGIPMPLLISSSTITFSRLSDQNVLPLISRVTISSVRRGLNGTVVSCVELDTNLVATTTIQIIDYRQFGKTPQYYNYVNLRDVYVQVIIVGHNLRKPRGAIRRNPTPLHCMLCYYNLHEDEPTL